MSSRAGAVVAMVFDAASSGSRSLPRKRSSRFPGRQAIDNSYRTVFEKGWSGRVFRFVQVHVTGDTARALPLLDLARSLEAHGG
jgi:ketosteroid isomerase-like protein